MRCTLSLISFVFAKHVNKTFILQTIRTRWLVVVRVERSAVKDHSLPLALPLLWRQRLSRHPPVPASQQAHCGGHQQRPDDRRAHPPNSFQPPSSLLPPTKLKETEKAT